MNKNKWTKWVGVMGRMLLAYALVFAQGAWATQNQSTKDKPASPQKAAAQQAAEKQSAAPAKIEAQAKQAEAEESERVAEEKPSRDGSHEGIKVHGHWTIEVRNPDGTLVTHREFENSLAASTGGSFLSSLLNNQGQASKVFYWAVVLSGSPGPCGSGARCFIAQLSFANANNIVACDPITPDSQNLIAAAPAAGSANGGSFVLSGTVVATTSSSITDVGTQAVSFVPFNAPDSFCPVLLNNVSREIVFDQFTAAAVAPTNVVAGQTIAVTVVISFS